MLFLVFLNNNEIFSQNWLPVLTNERGDTIPYTFPPPDSTYVKNEIIIKFEATALQLNKLCYEYYSIESSKDKKNNSKQEFLSSQKQFLLNQKFQVDSLLNNPNLISFIKSFGGDTLSRLTVANPCVDTISITRLGDTIKCNDFLWMKLKINNDSSALPLAILLSANFQSELEIASLDFYDLLTKTSLDQDVSNQWYLQYGKMDVENAWNYSVSNRYIKIAVIDDGLDYNHCDFGNGKGTNYKVVSGWNYTENNSDFSLNSYHGTRSAGILGALSNRACSLVGNSSGISGGWGNLGGQTDLGLGAQIFGFRCTDPDDNLYLKSSYVISAILEASFGNPDNLNSGYGYGVHIINYSASGAQYEPAKLSAVMTAYENNVNFVVARGNNYNSDLLYPACYSQNIVTSVGASDYQGEKVDFSSYGGNMDLLAPGFGIWSTKYSNQWGYYSGTSASAPMVSGCYGIMKSIAVENMWNNKNNFRYDICEPEDYEGMLKAASLSSSNVYTNEKGWGVANIGNFFRQLYEENYILKHYSIENTKQYGEWSPLSGLVTFTSNVSHYNRKLQKGSYYMKVREVTGYYDIDYGVFNDLYNIFVWGRGDRERSGGFSKALPNEQVRYISITNGQGSSSSVDGIIFNHRQRVNFKTYQYDIWDFDNNYKGRYPLDEEIKFNFSIWGKSIFSDVKYTNINNSKLLKFVSILDNKINIVFRDDVNLDITLKIGIYDLLGNKIFEVTEVSNNQIEINFSEYAHGLYIIKLTSGAQNEISKFQY